MHIKQVCNILEKILIYRNITVLWLYMKHDISEKKFFNQPKIQNDYNFWEKNFKLCSNIN